MRSAQDITHLQGASSLLASSVNICAHCGSEHAPIEKNAKHFCCQGCAQAYAILRDSGMLSFYNLADNAISSLKGRPAADYSYCDTPWFRGQFVRPLSDGRYALRMQLPGIHCAACVWLLEKLPEMVQGVRGARIHYLRKRLDVTVDGGMAPSKVIAFIASLGYTPDFTSEKAASKKHSDYDKSLLKKMAVAAFGFGNAMLFSLPEYLSAQVEKTFSQTFIALNAAIALFVLYYSAGDFFRGAWRALQKRRVVIDLPIAVGITAMFARSAADVGMGVSPGYFDTFAGLVFFLLLGRYVQSRSHAWLNFERDNVLFLPLAVSIKKEGFEETRPVHELKCGSVMRLRSGEICPTRARVLSSEAVADYAFISGEAHPITLHKGDLLETGAKILGASVELEAVEAVDPARLNRLWESAAEQESSSKTNSFAEKIIPWFTVSVSSIAFAAFFYWLPQDGARAWNAFSAVLIITCPCALAMAKPFTLFTTQSTLARKGLFLKSIAVVEKFFSLKHIVFDKTGTLTNPTRFDTAWNGRDPSIREDSLDALVSLARESSHPLSRAVADFKTESFYLKVENFLEKPGKGICGVIAGEFYFLGSRSWLLENGVILEEERSFEEGTQILAAKKNCYLGFFSVRNAMRKGLRESLHALGKEYSLTLLSGDNGHERERFAEIFSPQSALYFEKTPAAKKEIVEALKASGGVMMVGDGLNDAYALNAADVGVAITENHSQFSPASDAIFSASSLVHLPKLLRQARQAKRTLASMYALSFAYNCVGVAVAVTGALTPVFCAILMPISSLSVIGLSFASAYIGSAVRGLR